MSNETFWRHHHPLVLASQSTIRRRLLELAGLQPLAITAKLDERALEARLAATTPTALAEALATAKAAEVSHRFAGHIVIGADQVLVHAGSLLHKPKDRASAKFQIQALSGQTHELISGVAICRDGHPLSTFSSVATLKMRPLSEAFLDLYLDLTGDDVTRSVGGYQIEGYGIQLFENTAGDHATILGLPMLPLLAFLRDAGFLLS